MGRIPDTPIVTIAANPAYEAGRPAYSALDNAAIKPAVKQW
jgi:hypothetical protein